ncbi:phosphoglycolate phosphatase [Lampropedia hyalina DSM 16112]|uniref:Phosphoglycolate phosphatase n=1 Tax=Lampropedia hyalina DSM 16112 TaxID=1122156 RepID=A0A1M5F2A4_9BURK|nr:phosphoglycolate phosphatase [Lampropedia hyalina]SHF85654.1 phosphoglycolate phosphatase [Lampropedia hyalina DSM 16112]
MTNSTTLPPLSSAQTAVSFIDWLTQARPRAVLLDLDGTLVDTVADFDVALNQMLQQQQLPAITQAEIRQIVGKGSVHLIQSILAVKLSQAGLESGPEAVQQRFSAAWDAYLQTYLRINGQYATVYPGVTQGLQTLHDAGVRLAVVTNKPLALAQPLLKVKQLDALVEFLYGGDSFDRKKPDPYPLLQACERLQVPPEHTLMIGDSSNDAAAARAAGCGIALLRYGYNHGEPIDAVPAHGHFDSIIPIAEAVQSSLLSV